MTGSPILSDEEVNRRVLRREHLARYSPRCRQCHDPQVQLLDPHEIPAVWKCRRCKTHFSYEPADVPKAGTLGRCDVGQIDTGAWCSTCDKEWGRMDFGNDACGWQPTAPSSAPNPDSP